MAPIRNGRMLFNEIPTGYPTETTTVYDTLQTIDLDNVELSPNGVLIKVLCISADPYLRSKMRDASIEYCESAYILGEPLYGGGIGVVIKSSSPGLKSGDHIYCDSLEFSEYIIKHNPVLNRSYEGYAILENKENLNWSVYLGAAGMPGRTAFYGWKEHASPTKGEVAFVTTGAGPVGSMVIQLAKRDGLKVIACAGSEEKLKFMKQCGADIVFNYKTTSAKEVLKKEGPVDIYWDNVGGEMLDTVMGQCSFHARILSCGAISCYNSSEPVSFKNTLEIFSRRLRIFGIVIWDFEDKYGEEFMETIPKLIASGEIKYLEDVSFGLGTTGQAIQAIQMGRNIGKSVVVVANEED